VQIYTKTVYLLSTSTLKLLSFRVLPLTRRKNGRTSHLHPLLLTPFSSFPSLFFFRNIITFSTKFRGYIGVGILAPWSTALGGLLPPWVVELGPNTTAHGLRLKRRGVGRQVRAMLRAHSCRLLTPRATAFSP
jgi:hypothetical protein